MNRLLVKAPYNPRHILAGVVFPLLLGVKYGLSGGFRTHSTFNLNLASIQNHDLWSCGRPIHNTSLFENKKTVPGKENCFSDHLFGRYAGTVKAIGNGADEGPVKACRVWYVNLPLHECRPVRPDAG